MNEQILIVDDDEHIRTQMKWALAEDREVLLAEDREGALEIFRAHRPAVTLLDLGLPPHPGGPDEGLLTLNDILQEEATAKVIVISGQAEKENALAAIGQGAYDFMQKPIDVEELKIILNRAFHVARLEAEYKELEERVLMGPFEGMLGTSPQIQEVFGAIRKVATTDVPVLITGESGTGKELAARAIHQKSLRSSGPFVAINCGAIPETLLESELFGHEKGSFTGAHKQRIGRIEMAQGGTLFLDEIGELSAGLQVNLLRFLQEHCIERVGGRESIEVDARFIAATNKNIQKAIRNATFREDLFYRLAVFEIVMPPLRERLGDPLLLAKAFLSRYVAEQNKRIKGLNMNAQRAIEGYEWPGNIRELENRIKRAVIMAEGSKLTSQDLELSSETSVYAGVSLKDARQALERDLVEKALARNRGNMTRAAASLSISRPTLYELMEKLGIEKS